MAIQRGFQSTIRLTDVDGPAHAVKTLNERREDYRELSPKLYIAHAEGASDAFAVLAGRGWRSQHSDGDAAQAIERGHHSNDIGLAV